MKAFRRLLGAVALYDKLLVLWNIEDFYCNMYPLDNVVDPLRGILFNPYNWYDGCATVWAVHYGEVVLALLLMAAKGNGSLISAAMWWARTWNVRRLPMSLTGGDPLLSMALLASALMPRDAAAVRGTEPAVVMLRLQMCLVYIVSVLNKLFLQPAQGEARVDWLGGAAISQIFRCRRTITTLGAWLASYPVLCQMLTWMTIVIQSAACVALMCPGRARTVALVAVTLMHIGMALTMRLFNYMPIVFMVLTVFVLPTKKKKKKMRWNFRRVVAVFVTCLMLLLTARDTIEAQRTGWPLVPEREESDWLDDVADTLNVRSGWAMFSGSYRCAYFAVPAQLRPEHGGGWVDLYRVRSVQGEAPHWHVNVSRPSTQVSTILWEVKFSYTAALVRSINESGHCDYLTTFYCREYPMMRRITVLEFEHPDDGDGTLICNRVCD